MSKDSTKTNCLDDMEEELERDKRYSKTSVLIDKLATILISEDQMKDMGSLLAHFAPDRKAWSLLFKKRLNPSLDLYEYAIQGNAQSRQYDRYTKIHSFSNGLSCFEQAFVRRGTLYLVEYDGDVVYRFKNFRNADKISFLINKRIGEVHKHKMLVEEEGEKTFSRCVGLRNYYVRIPNYFLACFYQIEAIYLLSGSSFCFGKRKSLEEQWDILSELLQTLLGFYDESFFKGICYETAAVYLDTDASKYKKDCAMAKHWYQDSNKSYPLEAMGLHITYIRVCYDVDPEKGEKYVHTLLNTFENRYGKRSRQFAALWLHILGEIVSFRNENEYYSIFAKNYKFFETYLSQDDFYFECFYCFLMRLLSDRDQRYAGFLSHYEDLIQNNDKSELYYYHKAKSIYLKAQKLDMENQNAEAAELLSNAVYSYVQSSNNHYCSLFYVDIYLLAAKQYYYLHDYDEMARMDEFGLELCQKLAATDTEIYHFLYNIKGLKYLTDREFTAAKKIFNEGLADVEKNWGKENANYVEYTNNLALVALKEGRLADAKRHLASLAEVQNINLSPSCQNLLDNDRFILEQLTTDEELEGNVNTLYRATAKSMEDSNDQFGVIRMKLTYLFDKAQKKKILTEKDIEIWQELYDIYITKGFESKEQERFLRFVMILHKWNKDDLSEALSESEKLIIDMGEDIYLQSYKDISITHAQLLYLNKRCTETEEYLKKAYHKLYEQITAYGFGDIQTQLLYLRMHLSILIKIRNIFSLSGKNNELEEFYKKVVESKSIEKELLRILGKYHGNDKQTSQELYEFQNVHRKIAALKVRKQLLEEDAWDKAWDEEIDKYSIRLEELENELQEQIDFSKLVPEFSLNAIDMPHDAICVDFFSYYDYDLTDSIYGNKNNPEIKYIAFCVAWQNNKFSVLSCTDISVSENQIYELAELPEYTPEEMDTKQSASIILYLSEKIVLPLLDFISPYDTIFWGLDFVLQMLPMDVLLESSSTMFSRKNNIYVDSIRDVHPDLLLNLEETEALILGNPKYNIDDNYEQETRSLFFSEFECKEIAKLLGTTPFLGAEAKQQIFREKHQTDLLHISTHGDLTIEHYEDLIFERFLLTNSYVILAGFEDWLNCRMLKEYGNGLITADDFIFTDLSDTKLIVLSACKSGIGLVNGFQSLRGLRWAIGISGVQSSVTTLWTVDDFPTAVLMIFFYQNLRELPVSQALHLAKQQLRNLNMDDILKDKSLCEMYQKLSAEYKQSLDKDRPFANWRYWAGFVCYFE